MAFTWSTTETGLLLKHPHFTNDACSIHPPDQRVETSASSWRFGGYLFLRVFAFQYGIPGGAIGGHFKLKVVGRGRKHLNSESSFYGLGAHPCLALPDPSVAVHRPFGMVGF